MFESIANDNFKEIVNTEAKQCLSAGLGYLGQAQSYIDEIPRNGRTDRGIRLLQKQHDDLFAVASRLESIIY